MQKLPSIIDKFSGFLILSLLSKSSIMCTCRVYNKDEIKILPKGQARQGYSEVVLSSLSGVSGVSGVLFAVVSFYFPVTAPQVLLASQAMVRVQRLPKNLVRFLLPGTSFWKIVFYILGGMEPLAVSWKLGLSPRKSPAPDSFTRSFRGPWLSSLPRQRSPPFQNWP